MFEKGLGGFRLDEVLADLVVLGGLDGGGVDRGETAARGGDGQGDGGGVEDVVGVGEFRLEVALVTSVNWRWRRWEREDGRRGVR